MKYRDILGYTNKKTKKKVVKKQPKSSITEGLKEQFGDTINEGPSADYEKAHQKLKKAYYAFDDAYNEFGRLLIKKGLKPYGRQLDNQFRGVEKWWIFYNNLLDKLQ